MRLCSRQLLLEHFKQSNLRVILGSLRRWTGMTLRVMVPYLGLVISTFWRSRFASTGDRGAVVG
jgi:hypothetical protein